MSRMIDERIFSYEVWIDGRVYRFANGIDAMDFARIASRHIMKKSWESELPEIGVKIVTTYEDPKEPENDTELSAEEVTKLTEDLEKECEA